MIDEKKVPLPLIIAAVVVAIGLAVFMAVKSFGPPPPAPLTTQEKTNQDIILEMVKRTNGDMQKLTPEDSAKLREIAGNYGGMAFSDVAKKYKNGQLR